MSSLSVAFSRNTRPGFSTNVKLRDVMIFELKICGHKCRIIWESFNTTNSSSYYLKKWPIVKDKLRYILHIIMINRATRIISAHLRRALLLEWKANRQPRKYSGSNFWAHLHPNAQYWEPWPQRLLFAFRQFTCDKLATFYGKIAQLRRTQSKTLKMQNNTSSRVQTHPQISSDSGYLLARNGVRRWRLRWEMTSTTGKYCRNGEFCHLSNPTMTTAYGYKTNNTNYSCTETQSQTANTPTKSHNTSYTDNTAVASRWGLSCSTEPPTHSTPDVNE